MKVFEGPPAQPSAGRSSFSLPAEPVFSEDVFPFNHIGMAKFDDSDIMGQWVPILLLFAVTVGTRECEFIRDIRRYDGGIGESDD